MANRAMGSESISHLVVVGSSAGGIDALTTLVSTLPADFPAPIVLAQHLDPDRPSHLGEILQRRTQLSVHSVDGRTRLEPGTIFAIPSDRYVAITDHEVKVEARRGRTPSPSIDHLLTTAAEAFGEGLVAVILTGAGSDGAEGARRVKEHGGTVVIQDPQSAAYPSMPRSLAPTTVDIVANLDAIGPLLHDLVTGKEVIEGDEEQLLERFLEQVREATGVDFAKYKRPTIGRRLHRRMVATGSSNLVEYLRYVRANPFELQRLANSFLIKVTDFFRDPEVFQRLREQVLPELIAKAAEERRELRVWSAGCATGEEAYSLAITVAEALAATDREEVRARIFATDVDGEAIEFARRGIYSEPSVASVPGDLRRRYFSANDGSYEVSPSVRSTIVFGQHDLAQRAPFPRIDLVVCRNVLIYFTTPLQRRALELFAFSLRDGGQLVLGKSETVTPLAEHFAVEDPKLKVYRRRGGHVTLVLGGGAFHFAGMPTSLTAPVRHRPLEGNQRAAVEQGARAQGSRADSLMLRLPFGVVVVSRRYDVVSINLAARSMLGVHGPAIGEDLIHQAQPEASASLRTIIDAAFRGEPSEATLRLPPFDGTVGERVLSVSSYRDASADDGPDAVILLLRDVTIDDKRRADRDRQAEEQRTRIGGLEAQVARLSDGVTSLRHANEELTLANSELRSANDELVVSNEEVQAATEEVETLNEEMQATNEELETLNEELQATVEELNATNEDLAARTDELQRLALSLEKQRETSEAERSRLLATISSMADAVVVVDADGRIQLRNQAYDRTFGSNVPVDLEGDTGERIPDEETPIRRAAAGEEFNAHFILRDRDGNRRWFEAHGRPIGERGEGGVVVIRDVTERSLQRLQDEFVAMLSHELRNPLAGVVGYLDLLTRALGRQPDSRALRYAERASTQARRFSELIDELFDASRLRRGRMALRFEEVELEPLVREVVELAEAISPDHEFAVDVGRGDIRIRADRARLQQVLLNLASNAVRHAPESNRVEIRLRRRGGAAQIAVRDFGPGLDEKQLDRIVERLAEPTAARDEPGEGLGLGLYISSSIVSAHRGKIRVESAKGEGTTFTVTLPLQQPRAAGASRERDEGSAP